MSKMKKSEIREKRQRDRRWRQIIWTAVGVIALGVLVALLWPAFQPAVGEAAAVMPDTSHVAEGQDPGPYNTDPPTSGRHYAQEYEAGFYEEGDPQTQVPYLAGYLVHNLEHGYVIFWYNCQAAGVEDCGALKAQIRAVMEKFDNYKVIAFPWESIDEPVVMTSWGRIAHFERFNTGQAEQFVKRNQNKAPEPFAE